jgi:hypothetical protein
LAHDVAAIPMAGEDSAPVDTTDGTGAGCQETGAPGIAIEVTQRFHGDDPFCRNDRAAIDQIAMKRHAQWCG